jgi:hypothetical protein
MPEDSNPDAYGSERPQKCAESPRPPFAGLVRPPRVGLIVRRSIACLSSPAMLSWPGFLPEPAPKDEVFALPELIERRRGAAGGGLVKSEDGIKLETNY